MIIRGERNSDPALGTFIFEEQALIGDWGLQASSPFFPVVLSTSGRTTSLQPDATGMSFADLERAFGEKICFQGGISIQSTMPFGTPDSVTEAVGAVARVARDYNNYIFCTAHNIQADTPVANITALMKAYQRHG